MFITSKKISFFLLTSLLIISCGKKEKKKTDPAPTPETAAPVVKKEEPTKPENPSLAETPQGSTDEDVDPRLFTTWMIDPNAIKFKDKSVLREIGLEFSFEVSKDTVTAKTKCNTKIGILNSSVSSPAIITRTEVKILKDVKHTETRENENCTAFLNQSSIVYQIDEKGESIGIMVDDSETYYKLIKKPVEATVTP